MIKKIIKKFLRILLPVFNLFYIPYLYAYCRNRLDKLPKETQIFLMTRMDFGTFLYLVHYASCWERVRGKTCVVILTAQFQTASTLTKLISPHSLLIDPDSFILRLAIKLFRVLNIYDKTLLVVYARLLADYPHALRIWDPTVRACYTPFFDHRLKNLPSAVPEPFLNTYKNLRFYYNYCNEILLDSFHLHFECGLTRRSFAINHLDLLRKKLGIKENYVVMNLNCKSYKEIGTYRKTINFPQRYNVVIDFLIEQGFSVVIQGRNEQFQFKQRRGLVDYSRSGLCSIENDLALYSGSHFAILNKTGPESFTTVCNVPLLGVDYAELSSIIHNVKLRFFPKHLRSNRLGRNLSYKEYLLSPAFFDIGKFNHDPDIKFIDLEEDELMAAVKEFLPLASQSDEKWSEYTPEQIKFRSQLCPLHLDLYDTKAVPCDIYLKKSLHALS